MVGVWGRPLERKLVTCHRQRSKRRNFGGPCQRVVEIADAVHAAGGNELFGTIRLGGDQHRARDGPTHLTGEALDRPMVDYQAELGRRDAEDAALRGDAEVTRDHELGARAERGAIDGGQRGNRHLSETAQCCHECFVELTTFHTGEVSPGAKGRRSTRQNQTPRIGLERIDLRLPQCEQRRMIDSVASIGSVDRDQRNLVAKCEMHGHWVFRSTMRADCMTSPDQPPSPADPVRVRRAQVAKWNQIATRLGYLLFCVAIVMFFVALTTGFSQGKVTIITTSMIVGSVLLAPAIVVGYAVKAAEKDDVSRGL